MQNQKTPNSKKCLVFVALTLFLLSATAISTVCAQDTTRQPDLSSDSTILASDNPNLIATLDNGTAADDSISSDRAQDNSTGTVDDDAALYAADTAVNDDSPSTSDQTQPPYLYIGVALIAVLAIIAAFVVIVSQRRKTKI